MKTAGWVVLAGMAVWGETAPKPAIFTAAQAAAGQAYERTCGQCHTPTLMGRKGAKGEMPPVETLSASYQKFIGGRGWVPPLAGEAFLERWGGKTAAELIARFQVTASDPFFQFTGMGEETVVEITAYVLQVNGAKAGTAPLTRKTETVVRTAAR